MDITFSQPRGEDARILADGVVIGAVNKRNMLGRGYSKSFMSTRHVDLWTPYVRDVEGLDLDVDDIRRVETHIKRSKTTRFDAVQHLVDAYAAAGVDVPRPNEEPRAA